MELIITVNENTNIKYQSDVRLYKLKDKKSGKIRTIYIVKDELENKMVWENASDIGNISKIKHSYRFYYENYFLIYVGKYYNKIFEAERPDAQCGCCIGSVIEVLKVTYHNTNKKDLIVWKCSACNKVFLNKQLMLAFINAKVEKNNEIFNIDVHSYCMSYQDFVIKQLKENFKEISIIGYLKEE